MDAVDKTMLTQKVLVSTLFQSDLRKRALDEGVILGREQKKTNWNFHRRPGANAR
jgi:hypothetical protein